VSVASLLAALAVFVAAVRAWRSGERLYLLCALWFLIAVGPFLLTFRDSPTSTVAAERYLYLPTVALALAAGGLTASLARSRLRRALAVGLATLLIVCGVSCWHAAALWANPISLWEYVTSRTDAAHHPIPWVNLGQAYAHVGNQDQASRALQQAVGPGMIPDEQSVGVALGTLCRLESEMGWSHLEAGRLTDAVQRFSTAKRFCQRAVSVKPLEPDNALNAGLCGMGEFLARRSGEGSADLVLLDEACGRIEEASRQNNDNAWIARQRDRCQQLQQEVKVDRRELSTLPSKATYQQEFK
jgi:tetratricopeptide (TPR) repeat protein